MDPYIPRMMNPEEPKRYVILLFRFSPTYLDIYDFLVEKKRAVIVDSDRTQTLQQRMRRYPDDVIITIGDDDMIEGTLTIRNLRENKVETITMEEFRAHLDIYDDF